MKLHCSFIIKNKVFRTNVFLCSIPNFASLVCKSVSFCIKHTGEVAVVNNNQNASSTSALEGTSEGDHESVEIEANQQSELETRLIQEHANGSQSKHCSNCLFPFLTWSEIEQTVSSFELVINFCKACAS